MPQVSVVMPVYNGEKYLAEAIESILAQTFTDFELIIVDDGSTDSSAEIVRSYESRDGRIRFLQLERNMGACIARNRGSAAARGDYIAFMDCDDVSLPTRLEKQARFLHENTEIGVVGICSKVTNHDLTTVRFTKNVPRQHALIVLNIFMGAVSLLGGCIMIRHRPLRAVGGWNEGLRYGEESDLFVRLLLQTRIRFANLSEVLYIQRIHDSNKSSHSVRVADGENSVYLRRSLNALWDEVNNDTLARFKKLKHKQKLNWPERRAAKKDLKHLIASLIHHQMVEPSDRRLLMSVVNRRLEGTLPRHWLMFLHWYRYRIKRHLA